MTYGTAVAWIELVDVGVTLGGRDVIRGVSVSVGPGEPVVIVGPNGAGKTTLLRALAGLAPARAGMARIMGRDAIDTPRRVIAREPAYLPQQYDLAFPFAVAKVVLLGRYAQHADGQLRGVVAAGGAVLRGDPARAQAARRDVGPVTS